MSAIEHFFISEAKEYICSTVKSLASSNEHVAAEFHKIFSNAISTRGSASTILIGPVGSNKMEFVQNYLSKFKETEDIAYKLAIIDGDVIESDAQAVMSLADQLIEASTVKNFSRNSEDIYECFHQSYTETKPIVIVINSVESFAQQRRQMFLYLLLDLMQKKDLLFFVVGLTSNCTIHGLLEKRITSRLNASYLYLRPSMVENPLKSGKYDSPNARTCQTCISLAAALVLPDSIADGAFNKFELANRRGKDKTKTRNIGGASPSKLKEQTKIRARQLIQQFNLSIVGCFLDQRADGSDPEYCFEPCGEAKEKQGPAKDATGTISVKTGNLTLNQVLRYLLTKYSLGGNMGTSTAVSGYTGSGSDLDFGKQLLTELLTNSVQSQGANRGSLTGLIHCCLSWGLNDDFFGSVCHAAIYQLRWSGPGGDNSLVLSKGLLEDCIINHLDTNAYVPLPSLTVLLSALTRLELLVLIAIIKLYRSEEVYLRGAHEGKSGGGGGGADYGTSFIDGNNSAGGGSSNSNINKRNIQGVGYSWSKVYEMLLNMFTTLSDHLVGSSSTSNSGASAVPYVRALEALQTLVDYKIIGVSNTVHSSQQPKGAHVSLAACISDMSMVYLYIPIFVLRTEFQYEMDSTSTSTTIGGAGSVGGGGGGNHNHGQAAIKIYGDLIKSIDLTQLVNEIHQQEVDLSVIGKGNNIISKNTSINNACCQQPRKKTKLIISEAIRQTVLQVFVNKPV